MAGNKRRTLFRWVGFSLLASVVLACAVLAAPAPRDDRKPPETIGDSKQPLRIRTGKRQPSNVTFLNPGPSLVYQESQDDEAVIVFCDPATGKESRRLRLGKGCFIVSFSPDGTRAVIYNEKSLELLDVTTGKTICKLQGLAKWSSERIVFAPNAKYLAALFWYPHSGTRYVCVWDAADGKVVSRIEELPPPATKDSTVWEATFRDNIVDFSFGLDGKTLATEHHRQFFDKSLIDTLAKLVQLQCGKGDDFLGKT